MQHCSIVFETSEKMSDELHKELVSMSGIQFFKTSLSSKRVDNDTHRHVLIVLTPAHEWNHHDIGAHLANFISDLGDRYAHLEEDKTHVHSINLETVNVEVYLKSEKDSWVVASMVAPHVRQYTVLMEMFAVEVETLTNFKTFEGCLNKISSQVLGHDIIKSSIQEGEVKEEPEDSSRPRAQKYKQNKTIH